MTKGRAKTTVTIFGLLVATFAGAARAASLPVVIEKLNAAATACGISESQLGSVARRVLESSQWKPDADAGGWLNVRVTVTQAGRNACTARISVRMRAVAKPLPSDGTAKPKQRPRAPNVVLCNESGDVSALKAAFSSEVESATQYSIGQCLGSLKY
jgi:hypothetical protein